MIHDPMIQRDLMGRYINGRFPPNRKDGNYYKYGGYQTPVEECLCYDFAVLGYSLQFSYKGVWHYFMVDNDCVWLSDETFSEMNVAFANGNDVLLHYLLDGVPLYQKMQELEEYESM